MNEFPRLVSCRDPNAFIQINNPTSFTIGRSLSCDHNIDSMAVSRFHCTFRKVNNQWTLFDKSSNGTFVNSNKLTPNDSITINNGDSIALGSEDYSYKFLTSKSGDFGEASTATKAGPSEEVRLTPTMVAAFEEPLDFPPGVKTTPDKPVAPAGGDAFSSELTCSICAELFIKPLTLSCGHTYCSFCIGEWRKKKCTCPICRQKIDGAFPTLILSNFIEEYLKKSDSETREMREDLIKQRASVEPSSSGMGPSHKGALEDSVIEINSDEEDSEDSYRYDFDEDYDDESYTDDEDYGASVGYNGIPGRYYGGYGTCYICRSRGHWANGCPFKRT